MLDDAVLDALTERFYERADRDPLLGPVLAAALPSPKRPEHFAVFRDFWSRILLGSDRYGGNAFKAHEGLPLQAAHYDRWLEIFADVAAELLPAEAAERALSQARHMSECLQGKPSNHHQDSVVSWPLQRAAKPDRDRAAPPQGGACGG